MINIALIILVIKNTDIVFKSMLDNFSFLFNEAILLVIVKKTRGTTKVNIKLMNRSPKGLMYSIVLSLATIPITLPKIREITIEKVNQYFFIKFI